MTDYEQFCQRMQSVQSQFIEAAKALGRVFAPTINALINLSSTMRPNRKAARAMLQANGSKWKWYVREHKRRYENRVLSSGQHVR